MSDILDTKAGTAADLYPWPRQQRHEPVCASHDPELWFPHDKDDYKDAIALCGTCPLGDLCFQVALVRKETGIWGGALFKNGRVQEQFPQQGRPPQAAAVS